MKKILTLLALAILVLGCGKDNNEPEKKGDLNVTVVLNNFQFIENAEVYTDPISNQGKTDQFGSVLLKDLNAGSYEVFASYENIGTGKSVVNIKADELSEIVVNIIPGIDVGIAPNIEIILPSIPAEFSEGENINFSAVVQDSDTSNEAIQVTWASDLDGELNSNSPDASGNTSFTTNALSRGIHNITLTAKDEDGYTSSRTIEVSTLAPNSITLLSAVKNQGKIDLEWEKYSNSDFLKYEVYRTNADCNLENSQLLTTITNSETTSFIDELAPFEFKVCYYVKIINSENNSRNSNTIGVDLPSGYIFDFIPYDMVKHPTENFIYLLDQPGKRLLKFDYVDLKLVKEINLQGTIGFIDAGDNGFGAEIYAPSDDGWVYVYDANDLSLKTSISTGLANASVVVNGMGHVIVSMAPSPWWERPVRTFLRSNGLYIDGNGDFERDRLKMIPGKNEMISISTSVSPVDMEYFKLSSSGTIDIHKDDSYHGDHPLDPRIFRISNDGRYVVTSSQGAVYLANDSMEYKGQIQRGSLIFSDFAFSNDGTIIYAATSNRKSIQIGSYPSLLRNNEILTKGFPHFILRDGNQIISLSKQFQNSNNAGIEIIQL
ncbi:hypothetical protein [Polaribacter sp. R77954]|uniref:hypothetical protein n=1 Tax=Polaribacter sp. R77954 TaxID=3093870 RepID=UPI0037C5B723